MKQLFSLLALLSSFSLFAADINRELQPGASVPEDQNGGFLELGLGLGVFQSPFYGVPEGNREGESNWHPMLYLNINGRYQHNGFFIEANTEALHDFHIGYNLLDNGTWSVDFISSSTFDDFTNDESEDLKELKERRHDWGAGIRVGYEHQDFMMEFRGIQDISGVHDGQIASLVFGKSWQYRNWNFHGLIGGTYYAAKLTDYYFGIDKSEASDKFPETKLSSGFQLDFEVGLAYPISENWVYRAIYRYGKLPEESSDSPLIIRENYQVLATSLSYVF